MGTDPENVDTDSDMMLDGFEVDLGRNPLQWEAVTFLGGQVLLPGAQVARGATLRLQHPNLDGTYAGLVTQTNAQGGYGFSLAWPTALTNNASLQVSLVSSGALYSATRDLPFLAQGSFDLPDIVLELQPYTRGTDFYVGIPRMEYGERVTVMAIMNPGTMSATVTWRVPGLSSDIPGAQGSRTIAPGQATSVGLPSEELVHDNAWHSEIELSSRGVRVESNVPVCLAIQAYGRGETGMIGFSCLPTTAYGDEYYLQSLYSHGYSGPGGYSLVTAGLDDASLDLWLTIPMHQTVNGIQTLIPAGPGSAQVDFEDSLQFVTPGETFTGTRVRSDVPVGVIAGSTDLDRYVLGGPTGGTAIIESLAPTSQWGTSFISFGKVGNLENVLYIVAGSEGADVTISGAAPLTLLPGEGLNLTISQNVATTITSDRPVLVWQLFGWRYDEWYARGAAGVNLAPVERWSSDEVLWAFSATDLESFVAVLVPTSAKDDVRLNGQLMSSNPQTLQESVNGQYTVLITPTIGGTQRVTASQPVFPMVFGRATLEGFTYEAYAYAYSTVW